MQLAMSPKALKPAEPAEQNGQSKMKTFTITPDTLPQIFAKKTNRSVESLRKVLKNRLEVATENQRLSKITSSRNNWKDLTTYANSLLENDLKPVIELLYDYDGIRMGVTHLKHEVLQEVRRNRVSNVKQLLKNKFIAQFNKYINEGRLRNSDLNKINSIK